MRDEQFTNRQGETYVLGEDFSKDGPYRPLVMQGDGRKQWQPYKRNSGSYQSYSSRRHQARFLNYKGYVPYWFQDLFESVWDRIKLIAITAIISPIVFEAMPVLLKALFQP